MVVAGTPGHTDSMPGRASRDPPSSILAALDSEDEMTLVMRHESPADNPKIRRLLRVTVKSSVRLDKRSLGEPYRSHVWGSLFLATLAFPSWDLARSRIGSNQHKFMKCVMRRRVWHWSAPPVISKPGVPLTDRERLC